MVCVSSVSFQPGLVSIMISRSVWDFVRRKTDSEEGEEVTALTNCHLSITTVVCSAIEFYLQVLGGY